MLDTRSFALHVGVRTFEGRRLAAQPRRQNRRDKLLFNTSKEEYEARAAIVESAYIYKGCAIALSQELPPEMSVVLPMAANDLSPSTAWTPASSPWPKTAASTSAPAAWARSTSRSFWRGWAAAVT